LGVVSSSAVGQWFSLAAIAIAGATKDLIGIVRIATHLEIGQSFHHAGEDELFYLKYTDGKKGRCKWLITSCFWPSPSFAFHIPLAPFRQ
jgi:hypothetical protein